MSPFSTAQPYRLLQDEDAHVDMLPCSHDEEKGIGAKPISPCSTPSMSESTDIGPFDEQDTELRVGRAGIYRRARAAIIKAWAKIGGLNVLIMLMFGLWVGAYAIFDFGHGHDAPRRHHHGDHPRDGHGPLRALAPIQVAPLYVSQRSNDAWEQVNSTFALDFEGKYDLTIPPACDIGSLVIEHIDNDAGELILMISRPIDESPAAHTRADAQLWLSGPEYLLHLTEEPSEPIWIDVLIRLPADSALPAIRTNLAAPASLQVDRSVELLKDTHDIKGQYDVSEHAELVLVTHTGDVDATVSISKPAFPPHHPEHPPRPPRERQPHPEKRSEEDNEERPPRGPPGRSQPPPPPGREPRGPDEPRRPPGPPPPPGPPRRPGPHEPAHPHHPPPPPTRITAMTQIGDVSLRVLAPAFHGPRHNVTDEDETTFTYSDDDSEDKEDESSPELGKKHKHRDHHDGKHGDKHHKHDDDHRHPPPPHGPHGPHDPDGPHGPPPPWVLHAQNIHAHTVHGNVRVDHANYTGRFSAETRMGKIQVTAGEGKEVVVFKQWMTEEGGGVEGLIRPIRANDTVKDGEEEGEVVGQEWSLERFEVDVYPDESDRDAVQVDMDGEVVEWRLEDDVDIALHSFLEKLLVKRESAERDEVDEEDRGRHERPGRPGRPGPPDGPHDHPGPHGPHGPHHPPPRPSGSFLSALTVKGDITLKL